MGLWAARELALRRKAGRTGRLGRRPQPSQAGFFRFLFQGLSFVAIVGIGAAAVAARAIATRVDGAGATTLATAIRAAIVT